MGVAWGLKWVLRRARMLRRERIQVHCQPARHMAYCSQHSGTLPTSTPHGLLQSFSALQPPGHEPKCLPGAATVDQVRPKVRLELDRVGFEIPMQIEGHTATMDW